MVESRQMSRATYRAKLADVVRRATALEQHARTAQKALPSDDPERASWIRIERRYATIRGNAQHLLLVHDRQRYRKHPLYRLGRYLHIL